MPWSRIGDELAALLFEAATRFSTQLLGHYRVLLKINLAKKAEAKPKQIKVNVGSEKTVEG
jgi:hypothetical protein